MFAAAQCNVLLTSWKNGIYIVKPGMVEQWKTEY